MGKEGSHMYPHFGVMKTSLDMLPEKPSQSLQEEFLLLLRGPQLLLYGATVLFVCLFVYISVFQPRLWPCRLGTCVPRS